MPNDFACHIIPLFPTFDNIVITSHLVWYFDSIFHGCFENVLSRHPATHLRFMQSRHTRKPITHQTRALRKWWIHSWRRTVSRSISGNLDFGILFYHFLLVKSLREKNTSEIYGSRFFDVRLKKREFRIVRLL